MILAVRLPLMLPQGMKSGWWLRMLPKSEQSHSLDYVKANDYFPNDTFEWEETEIDDDHISECPKMGMNVRMRSHDMRRMG